MSDMLEGYCRGFVSGMAFACMVYQTIYLIERRRMNQPSCPICKGVGYTLVRRERPGGLPALIKQACPKGCKEQAR